jgi:hypothetical protein
MGILETHSRPHIRQDPFQVLDRSVILDRVGPRGDDPDVVGGVPPTGVEPVQARVIHRGSQDRASFRNHDILK